MQIFICYKEDEVFFIPIQNPKYFELTYFLTEKRRSKRGVSLAKETSQNNYRETRSVSNKHLEVMMVGDHLFLQRFGSEDEAAGVLLLLAHMVRQRRDIFIF